MEAITDADIRMQIWDQYQDLYLQSNTPLLLADVFKSFQNKCIVLYELYTVYFLSVPRLAWQGFLKNKSWTALLTDVDMLLMVGKSIRHVIHT